ncbi:PadR family transcriptional regulator [Paraburkholderia susongensis]|uniref:DNA-binding transcriptional regulator, PadR family n=1 Tax=Paraburkholderia susongensis TaxID=1515439 RepID=A0A1X7M5G7_9BURK|nr:PadR family transcriptional regulator [Paraburkholderia susongensis]SMG61436.1 DNA-binding transcriptional regulator, PadR family [Paraburkholderia susongensis]
MRHSHRFSGPRGADAHSHGDFGRESLHALWHVFHGNAHRGRRHHEFHADARNQNPDGFGTPAGSNGPSAADPREHVSRHAFPHQAFSLHALWHAISRHHDHRFGGRGGRFGGGFGGPGGPGGFGGFGGGPGGFGGEGDGFPRGRKFSSDDLQLLLLSLIDAQPSHGYELIKALETRSNGFYSPSPGMVYPALTYLEELGYVTVQLEGNRKRYELSDAGREYLAANRERVELMLARLAHIARKMDSVRRAFAGQEPADVSEGGWVPELNEARRTLKNALLRRDNAPADEQRRIAAILMRAAREIEDASAGKDASENPGENGEPTA